GRDPAALQVQAPLPIQRGDDGGPDLARSVAAVPDLVASGATDIHVALRAFNRDPADAPAVLVELVRRFADAAH
ncbi:MAG TPA: LLM class F420-dependent oxidoreductase, partial [Acidimicrobiia bacterium]|nr:LLM class F420-dependent oxidoreductase [Acidimicrobiia bacterium]